MSSPESPLRDDGLQLLCEDDHDIAHAIAEEAYGYLLTNKINIKPQHLRELSPVGLSSSVVCPEASDLVTRIAQRMGFVAARERTHTIANYRDESHAYTTFAPPDSMPSDDDLIMCLTWGQFVKPKKYAGYIATLADSDHPEFFGRRGDIPKLHKKDNSRIEVNFAPKNVVYRATTFCYPDDTSLYASWLDVPPEDLATGAYPIGEVDPAAYPDDMWTHAP